MAEPARHGRLEPGGDRRSTRQRLGRPEPTDPMPGLRGAPVTAEIPLAGPVRPGGDTTAGGAAALDQPFDAGTLHLLREAVLAHATAAGIPEARAAGPMLGAHELAASAVRHGAGTGQLRMRAGAGTLRCQVDDAGAPGMDGAAARPDGPGAQDWPYRSGHGPWLVREAAGQVSVSAGPGGSRVVPAFTMPAAAASSAAGP
jgi:hypothetical protein